MHLTIEISFRENNKHSIRLFRQQHVRISPMCFGKRRQRHLEFHRHHHKHHPNQIILHHRTRRVFLIKHWRIVIILDHHFIHHPFVITRIVPILQHHHWYPIHYHQHQMILITIRDNHHQPVNDLLPKEIIIFSTFNFRRILFIRFATSKLRYQTSSTCSDA